MKILVACYHSLIDPSSGAAISLRSLLEALVRERTNAGPFEIRVLQGPHLDFSLRQSPEQILADHGISPHLRLDTVNHCRFLIFHCMGIAYSWYLPDTTRKPPTIEEGRVWMRYYDEILDSFHPDVLITYGGYRFAGEMLSLAENRGIRTVFWLCNFAYKHAGLFTNVERIIVPSEFARNEYRRSIGIECEVLPPIVDPEKVRVFNERVPKYLSFINPSLAKGAVVLTRLLEMLEARTDIPFLVVESRQTSGFLAALAPSLKRRKNLFVMKNTPDPRDFYRLSRILLFPSLVNESFGLVAAEAQLNGIPVIGSNRGAIPEVVRGGITLEIPERYTPETWDIPGPEELTPWKESIERLWDEETALREYANKGMEFARQWSPENIAKRFRLLLEK